MSAVTDRMVSTWNELSAVAAALNIGDILRGPAYVFRGQENAAWKLAPSLHRALTSDWKRPLPDPTEALRVEKYLVEQFRAFAPNHLPSATLAATHAVIDWWTVMRHYGVPSRVLDVTGSIYVATYFAVTKGPDVDGVVYGVHCHTVDQAMIAVHGSDAPLPDDQRRIQQVLRQMEEPDAPPIVNIIARKTALPDRIIAQQGGFLVCRNVLGDIEEIIASEVPKVSPPGKMTLLRLRIPASVKPEFMRHLRAMNVTASSLFPGLDGIGRHLEESVRWR